MVNEQLFVKNASKLAYLLCQLAGRVFGLSLVLLPHKLALQDLLGAAENLARSAMCQEADEKAYYHHMAIVATYAAYQRLCGCEFSYYIFQFSHGGTTSQKVHRIPRNVNPNEYVESSLFIPRSWVATDVKELSEAEFHKEIETRRHKNH